MKKSLFLFAAILLPAVIPALEPPKPGELEMLKASGQIEKRQEFAKKLGNNIMKLKAPGVKAYGFDGIPTSGSPKIFALLIDFPDYPHTIEASTIQNMLFGQGDPANYPYESLSSYYERSSYDKLHIGGDVYGWYRAQNNRAHYTDDSEGLIKEALAYFHSQGARFDKYDNNGNGEIEFFGVFWTGPDEGWASFWWGWQGFFYDPEYSIDGKKLGAYEWQWEEDVAWTVIHESGHALGLPDYYDYDDSVGPVGGTGGLDMMDGVWGDHNAFSKWMLGWITPEVVTNSADLTLPPLSTTPYAVVLSKDFDGTDYGSEFFVVQNRYRTKNDSDFPTDGVMIHHVDARRDCNGYTIYDNSYTEHKLLRLMEADGLEEIEKGRWGDEGDFYKEGNNPAFTPGTFPCSDLYNGRSSFVNVTNISAGKEQMTAHFAIESVPDLEAPAISAPANEAVETGTVPEIKWNQAPNASAYEIEIHEGVNTVCKSGVIAKENLSYKVPAGKLEFERNYTIWLRAKGDGTNYGSSAWTKRIFSTTCGDKPYWEAKTFFDPPCYSTYAGFAYYPPTGVFVRFSGNGSNDTFEYDGSKWTSYSTYPAPSARYYTAMAYDPANEKILLFGGYNDETDDVYGDTWEYDPVSHTWQELDLQSSPPAHWAFRAATDTDRKTIVIFAPEETWEWNGSAWTKTQRSGPGYYYGNLAYDRSASKVVYFGGYEYPPGVCKNETWTYDISGWHLCTIGDAPPARCDAVLAYDTKLQKTVLFGGSDEYYNIFNDTWSFDGASWNEIESCGNAPSGYYDNLGGYDEKRGRLVVAKGSSDTSTFELVGPGNACSPSFEPLWSFFAKEGGNGSIYMTIGEECQWTASSDSGWITITSAPGGTGSANISYSVSANTGDERSGNISVGGVVFAVTQATGTVCSPVLDPQSQSFTKDGGNGNISLAISSSCSWTASSGSDWITVTSPSSGTGPALISYSVLANPGGARSGNISVNGMLFTITQESGVAPPQVSSVVKMTSPFRLKVAGSNFKDGIRIYIGEGSEKTEWTAFVRKSSSKIVLKGGAELKSYFPKGVEVTITLQNPDGGAATTKYKR